MGNSEDIINKLTVTFSFSGQEDDTAYKRKGNELYDKYVYAALEKLFVNYHLHPIFMQKLEIDVGSVSPENLESAVYEALERKFVHYLSTQNNLVADLESKTNQSSSEPYADSGMNAASNRQTIPEPNATSQGDPVKESASPSIPATPSLIPEARTSSPKTQWITQHGKRVECLPPNESRALLADCLLNLSRPWYLTEDEFDVRALVASCQLSVDYLKELFVRDRLLFYRLLRILNYQELRKLLVTDKSSTPSGVSFGNVVAALTAEAGDSQERAILELLLLARMAPEHSINDMDALPLPYPSTAMNSIVQLLSSPSLSGRTERRTLIDEIRKSVTSDLTEQPWKERLDSEIFSLASEQDERMNVPDQRWPVNNAGLSLLSPWFVPLFDTLHYLDGKHEFKTIGHQERAALLLHYLMSSTEEANELDLTFNKVLVGLPMSYPLDCRFEPTQREKDEINTLLSMVISYWPSLKGTSVRGFQETFIHRNGALEKMEDNFLLRVEEKTLDILMNDLPWTYTVISCPWNNYLIYVEWNTL